MSLETDKERVTCLLLINTQLMKKAINIYTNLLTNKQILLQIPPQNKQTIMELYQNCTRRIHCNLSVLTYINEKYNSDGSQGANSVQQGRPQFPFIMSAPPDMPELNQLYSKLQELYPEALQFLKMKIQQLKKSQGQQGQQGQQGLPLNSGIGAPNPAIGSSQQGPGGAMPPSMAGAGLGGVGGLINQSPAAQQFPPHQISHTPHHQQFMVNSPAPSNVSGDASAFKSNNDFNGGGGGGFSGGNSSIYDPSMLMQQQQQQQFQQQQKSSISPQLILQMNQGNGNGGNGNSNGMLDLF